MNILFSGSKTANGVNVTTMEMPYTLSERKGIIVRSWCSKYFNRTLESMSNLKNVAFYMHCEKVQSERGFANRGAVAITTWIAVVAALTVACLDK
jgi:hypothetical protein